MDKDEALRISQVIFVAALQHKHVNPTVTVLRDGDPVTFAVIPEPDLDDMVHAYLGGTMPLIPKQASATRAAVAMLEPQALIYLTGGTAIASDDGQECESLIGWTHHVETGSEHVMAVRRTASGLEALDLSSTRIEGIEWVKALL